MNTTKATFDPSTAAALLGVDVSATPEELRAAYLKKVQQHPPDHEPEMFEQIRDAYEQLRNPDVRAKAVLRGPDPGAPLTDLFQGFGRSRAFVGSDLWVQLLKEKRA